ncbi:MAG: L-threonylcarbamoyladenylate synthase [Cyanothece sp. SIO2G6]|nr:L-threonylcarbamoyladenylate synthase [Cyanothece sp. SIO2G6]
MTQVSLDALIMAAREGDRLISLPTDTIPALASRPERAAMIYMAKKRSLTKPLILMAAHADDLWGYVQRDHPAFSRWQQVAFWYWPGALTLVLPACSSLPRAVNPTNPSSIGIRVPNCAIARHILQQTGPLATTSVNRSGQPPLETIAAINQGFPNVLTLQPSVLEENKWGHSTTIMELLQPQQTPNPKVQSHHLDPYATLTIPLPTNLAAPTAKPTPTPAATRPSRLPSTVIRWGKQGWEILRQGSVVLPAHFFD